ncbi:MAG: Protein-disulfide isomerase [Rhodobacteraceae bacterium HLUCCA08]|nr:MAG: Protein-disulfide isomerase [Rhodobacteraceae bacterium HLUCCA08]
MKRRDLLVLGGIIAGIATVQGLLRRRDRDFVFDPLDDLPPFRRLETGAVTATDPLLIGLDSPTEARLDLRAAIRADPAAALFRDPPPGALPIAAFTDYNCAFCPQMSRTLVELGQARDDIHLSWHDLPLLGPGSDRAARAAVAADLQGAYLPVHEALMRTNLRPGPAALRALAEGHGLDPDRMVADAAGPQVAARIDTAHAMADVLGLAGTPATVVGRTIVLGRLERDDLDRLIALERAAPAI